MTLAPCYPVLVNRRLLPAYVYSGVTAMSVSSFLRRSVLLCTLLLGVATGLSAFQAKVAPRTSMVPMADDVKLATDVYLPATGKPPYPTILLRTPYGKTTGRGITTAATGFGYAVVVQDM